MGKQFTTKQPPAKSWWVWVTDWKSGYASAKRRVLWRLHLEFIIRI